MADSQQEKKRVLVVDDEPDVLEICKITLRAPHLEILTESTYEGARARLLAGGVDLAVLDVMGVRGYDLLSEFGEKIPCVMLTGVALSVGDVRQSFDQSAALFIPKERLVDLPECVRRTLTESGAAEGAGKEVAAPPLASRRRLWRWFVDHVDFSRWLGPNWSGSDPRLAAEIEVLKNLRSVEAFSELPESELQTLADLAEPMEYETGALICHAGDPGSAGLYLVQRGTVNIRATGDEEVRELNVGHGSTFGDATLVLDLPPAGNATAEGPVGVYRLSATAFRDRLEDLSGAADSLLSAVGRRQPTSLVGSSVDLAHYLRMTQDRHRLARSEIALMRSRLEFGGAFVAIILLVSLYTFCLALLRMFDIPRVWFTLGVTVLAAVMTVVLMRVGKQPLSTYGVNTKDWRRSLRESAVVTAIVMLLLVLAKWACVRYVPEFQNHPVFEPEVDGMMAAYAVVVVFQEFVARGFMQTTLQRLLAGRRANLWAICSTSLIFGVVHLHYSIVMGVLTVLLGLLWGGLYARQGTLIGVIASHLAIGWWWLHLLGGKAIVTNFP